MKKIFIITILFLSGIQIFSNDAKGPLQGKNYYIPFLPYYSFPGFSAAQGNKGDLSFSISQYLIQDFVVDFQVNNYAYEQERFFDYEGYIFETTVSYNFLSTLEVGLTARLHAYYGGFGDSIIEAFHDFFGFPNGGREYYPENDVHINIQTDKGLNLNLEESSLGFGDMDLFLKWNFLSLPFMDSALFSAVKIPTGSVEKITGSGYMDIAASLLLDFHIFKWFSLYIHNGIILPGQLFVDNSSSPKPIYSALFALEFIISPRFSLITQFRLNTSSIDKSFTLLVFIFLSNSDSVT